MTAPVAPTNAPVTALRAAFLVGAILLAVGLWAIGTVPAGSFYDDGIYLSLGHALSEGAGYRYLNLPGAPAATHYPPGYPALLAICWWVGGELPRVLLLAKGVNAALMAMSGGMLTWLLIAEGVPALAAAIGVVAGTIAVPVLASSTIPFSEPLFLTWLLLSAILTRRTLRTLTVRDGVLAGICWGLLFLSRTIGIVLLPVGGWLLYRRAGSRPAFAAVASALVLALPWILWSGRHAGDVPVIVRGSYGSYAGWYFESLRLEGPALLFRIARHNAAALMRPLGVLLSPPGPAWLGWIAVPAGIVVLGAGMASLWRRSSLLAGTLGLYLVVVLVWPYPPDRFIWGIWPLVTATLAMGFVELRRRQPTTPPWRGAFTVVLMFAAFGSAGYLYRQGAGVINRAWEGPQRASAESMQPAVDWVKAHAPPGTVIATVDDPLLHLYAGRPSVPALAWSAAEYGREQSVDTAVANLGKIMAAFRPALIILPGGGTPEAFAVERMWREERRLELIDTLHGGGAVFRPLAADSVR